MQRATFAQAPMQGFTHLLLKQALSLGQSEFKTHSGRQPAKGFPWNSGKQVHSPLLHWVLAPQGEGLHLSIGVGSTAKMNFVFK